MCNARAETTEKEAVRLREDFRYEGMNGWMNGGLLSRSVVKRVREIEKVIGYGFGGDRWKEGTKEQKKNSSRSSRERTGRTYRYDEMYSEYVRLPAQSKSRGPSLLLTDLHET